jgi:hypothetical protein
LKAVNVIRATGVGKSENFKTKPIFQAVSTLLPENEANPKPNSHVFDGILRE